MCLPGRWKPISNSEAGLELNSSILLFFHKIKKKNSLGFCIVYGNTVILLESEYWWFCHCLLLLVSKVVSPLSVVRMTFSALR
jgi:hypothetical protein